MAFHKFGVTFGELVDWSNIHGFFTITMTQCLTESCTAIYQWPSNRGGDLTSPSAYQTGSLQPSRGTGGGAVILLFTHGQSFTFDLT